MRAKTFFIYAPTGAIIGIALGKEELTNEEFEEGMQHWKEFLSNERLTYLSFEDMNGSELIIPREVLRNVYVKVEKLA